MPLFILLPEGEAPHLLSIITFVSQVVQECGSTEGFIQTHCGTERGVHGICETVFVVLLVYCGSTRLSALLPPTTLRWGSVLITLLVMKIFLWATLTYMSNEDSFGLIYCSIDSIVEESSFTVIIVTQAICWCFKSVTTPSHPVLPATGAAAIPLVTERKLIKRNRLKHIPIHAYCICELLESFDSKMIECDMCHQGYHLGAWMMPQNDAPCRCPRILKLP